MRKGSIVTDPCQSLYLTIYRLLLCFIIYLKASTIVKKVQGIFRKSKRLTLKQNINENVSGMVTLIHFRFTHKFIILNEGIYISFRIQ